MCNKMSFKSKVEAKKEAERISVNSRFRTRQKGGVSPKAGNLKPYLCWCTNWHLSSLPTSITRRVAKRLRNAK